MNSDLIVYVVIILIGILLVLWRYKKMHYLGKITNKINIAKKNFI